MQTVFRVCSVIALVFFLSGCDVVGSETSEMTQRDNLLDFVYWENDPGDKENPVQEARSLERNFTPTLPVDFLAYYPFNGNANDESGKGNHGTVFGASLTTNRFGRAASAYAFDGDGDYIEVPHSPSLDLGALNSSYSVAAWVKASNPSRARIVQKWDEFLSTPYPFSLRAEPDDVNHALYDGSQVDILSLNNIWDGQWHHVVFTVSLALKVQYGYVDGNLVSMQSLAVTAPLNNAVSMTIGAGVGVDRDFLGAIDDVVIYGRAFTENEVRRLYRYTR